MLHLSLLPWKGDAVGRFGAPRLFVKGVSGADVSQWRAGRFRPEQSGVLVHGQCALARGSWSSSVCPKAAGQEMSGTACRAQGSPCQLPALQCQSTEPPEPTSRALCHRDPPSRFPCAFSFFQPPEQYFEIYGKLIIDYRSALVQGR